MKLVTVKIVGPSKLKLISEVKMNVNGHLIEEQRVSVRQWLSVLTGADPAWNYGAGAKKCGLKVKWWQELEENSKVFKTTSLGPQNSISL